VHSVLKPRISLPWGTTGAPVSVRHQIYGLRIAADRAIPGLPPLLDSVQKTDLRIRLNGATPAFPLVVSNWTKDIFYSSSYLDSAGRPALRVAASADGAYFGFFYSDGARFAIDREGRELWADWPEGYSIEDAATYLVGPVLGFVLRLRGITPLHGSAVAIDNQAIALVGVPGAGKSTTAAAFAHLGFAVLSDDVVVLEDAHDHFLVAPGYPRVNLWPDSVRLLLGSEDALPRITPTWEKHYLPLDQNGRRFQSEHLPLAAVYFLDERDPSLKIPVIEELAAGDALMTLVANTYVNYVLDRDMRQREFDLLSSLVARVSVRRIRPSADPSAVLAMCEAIAKDVRVIMDSSPATAASGAD
jgi:hypothetical protein